MADPITTSNDLWAFVPGHLRNEEQPIVDDTLEALTAICVEYQDQSTEAAKQCDIGQAEDQFLTGLASDHEVQRQPGESDATLRTRLTQAPLGVSHVDIATIVNSIVAAYNTTWPYCRVIDSILDQAYIPVDGSSFLCFVQNAINYEAPPYYPERYYSQIAATSDRPCSRPTGAHIFSDSVGRQLMILVPEPDNSANRIAMLGQIVNAVTTGCGQGIRWSVWIDPSIGTNSY